MTQETVLITGGTGFLGRRLALALKDSHRVVLAARNNKQNADAQHRTGCLALPMDVARLESVRDTFLEVRPDIVIHAAATKYVDLAERQPMECLDVNVLGSQNVARVAIDLGVRTVIGISTDKTAPPVKNLYGMSKAVMERSYCLLDGKTATRFACVRFGNIAWSTGSVFPIWRRMHRETGVIGTTAPESRRFFFSGEEAAELVLTALRHIDVTGGKILSRKMKSTQMSDVLDVWTKHLGGRWERIAPRPGDYVDEQLFGEVEIPFTTEIDLDGMVHFLISMHERAERPVDRVVDSKNAERLSEAEILDLIQNPPPEEA